MRHGAAQRRRGRADSATTCDNDAFPGLDIRCAMSVPSAAAAPLRKWMCVVCGFIYDEMEGLPEEGIPPGTRWEDIPDTWTCPDCGVTKDDFEMIEFD
jgi:rubredoxin